MAISRLSIIKFLELAISIVCIGLHYKSKTNNFDADTLSAAAYGGFIVILIGVFAGYLMSTPINRRIDIFYGLVGCAVFVASAALNIKIYQDYSKSEWRDCGLAKASLSIINGALFLLDALLTWRGDF